MHSAIAQAEGNRAAGLPVRRTEIETVHPIIRVHPTTGWKSVYVYPGKYITPPLSLFSHLVTFFFLQGFTRRIVGVPKAESDAILTFLFHQISENPDHQVRFRWEVNSIAFWDNRVSNLLEHFFLKMKIYLLFIIRLSLIQLHSIFGLLCVMHYEPHLKVKNQSQ